MPDQQRENTPTFDDPSVRTVKIALVMAGGVSLGSFEAGVVTELLYALDTLNRRTRATGIHYELDVMTGGSAGGMTAALAARILMYDLPGRRRHLHRAWVRDIDIRKLLDKAPTNALLSKQALFEIIHNLVLSDADQPPVTPASFAPEVLRLSLSLSNMHGMTYAVPALAGNSFVTTLFSDMGRFEIEHDAGDDRVHAFHATAAERIASSWDHLARTAVACGNFPLAFQPEQLVRPIAAYPDALERKDSALFERGLCFIDGGLFNNEPLGEAIDRARQADGGANPDRIYLLVDPSINRSRHQADISSDGTLRQHGWRLLQMIRGESTARDWMRAGRHNIEIGWRDRLVEQLSGLLDQLPTSQSQSYAEQLERLASDVLATEAARTGVDLDLDRSLRAVREVPVIDAASAQLESAEKRRILNLTTLILNYISHLADKSEINMHQIGVSDSRLAGDEFAGFIGFFQQDWREYDYRIGRTQAFEALQGILGASYGHEPADPDDPPAMPPQDPSIHQDYDIPDSWHRTFPDVGIEDVDEYSRRDLRDALLERYDQITLDLGWKWVARKAVKTFFVRGALNDWLHL